MYKHTHTHTQRGCNPGSSLYIKPWAQYEPVLDFRGHCCVCLDMMCAPFERVMIANGPVYAHTHSRRQTCTQTHVNADTHTRIHAAKSLRRHISSAHILACQNYFLQEHRFISEELARVSVSIPKTPPPTPIHLFTSSLSSPLLSPVMRAYAYPSPILQHHYLTAPHSGHFKWLWKIGNRLQFCVSLFLSPPFSR